MQTTDISFPRAFDRLRLDFMHRAEPVHTERWQGADISKKPEMLTHELLNARVCVELHGHMNLHHWRDHIKPNLPWADDHFAERVCGEPLNPGVQWANWPYAKSADTFREGGQFNHTYMERLWPKYAGRTFSGNLKELSYNVKHEVNPHSGIRFTYGDLSDLVKLLAAEPLTRQAWLPLFFPEDTGIGDGGRKPCTLGYQFIMRNNRLHIYYPLRSCDFIRHMRDDCYLAVRLLIWVIEQCRQLNPVWENVKPGLYTMHMTSLHIFENDRALLRRPSEDQTAVRLAQT